MTWSFTLWGPPLSVNHIYEPARKTSRRGREYMGRKLTAVAQKYRDDAQLIIGSARPSHWAPEGQVRILWDLYLARDMDCDNAMKLVHDAIQLATGVNDARFLPCVMSKTTGVPPRAARAEIRIVEASGSLLQDLATLGSTPTP